MGAVGAGGDRAGAGRLVRLDDVLIGGRDVEFDTAL